MGVVQLGVFCRLDLKAGLDDVAVAHVRARGFGKGGVRCRFLQMRRPCGQSSMHSCNQPVQSMAWTSILALCRLS